MKREDLTRLETAVRETNPVPHSNDLVDSEELAAVAVLVRAGTGAAPLMPGLDSPGGELQTSPIGRRVWAFAAGLAAMVLVVGLVAVLRPPGGGELADDVTTTNVLTTTVSTTVATTTVGVTPPGPVGLDEFVFPAAEVPAFTATVVYDMNPLGADGSIPAEAQMTVLVLFNSPEDYLYEVLSTEPANEAMEVFGAAGFTVLGAGEQSWIKEPGDAAALPAENFGPVRHLLWNAGRPAWSWYEICSASVFEALGAETIAGRATSHGRCSNAADDYELWVDTETGVVMKLRGALEIGDLMPTTTRDGGYEIVELTLGEVELPDPPQAPGPGVASALPLFHAVQVGVWDSVAITREIWYQDARTWRHDITESNIPEEEQEGESAVGTFHLMVDGLLRGCDASIPSCFEQEDPEDADLPVSLVPVATIAQHCDLVGEEQVLNRTADHYVCGMALDEYSPGNWVPGVTLETPAHRWVDQATSIQLRYEHPSRQTWFSVFEVNPLFPAGVFDYVPLKGRGGCPLDDPVCEWWSNTLLVKDEPAPKFTGPLLDGTTFSFEDLRGQPAVVFRWADAFAPGVLEQFMDDLQALSEKWDGRVGFLGVPEATADETERIMIRGGYTFQTLACTEEGAAGTVVLCEPDTVGSLWRTGWPSWVILDKDGNVVDGFGKIRGTYDDIDAAIEAVLNS